MKTYLILGGNGFLGRHLSLALAEHNHVIVTSRNMDRLLEHENIEYKKLDFLHCEDFTPYLEGVDVVIHLISTITPNDHLENINKEIEENIFPTIRLLNAMVASHVSKMIFLSSGGAIYGNHTELSIRESEPTNPICNYGIVKLMIEKYLYLYHHFYGLDYKIVRLANPYSVEINRGGKQGVIPVMVDHILNDLPFNIWGDGSESRDYIYIDDAIEGILSVIDYEGENCIFNIGTGKGHSLNECIDIMQAHLEEREIDVHYNCGRKCDVNHNVLNIDKVISEVGWMPKTSLEDGIDKLIERKFVKNGRGKK